VPRVVGTDPGTSSLDILLLDDGRVADQSRLTPADLRSDPAVLSSVLDRWAPIDLIAGPSGYGLPLIRGDALSEHDLDLMALVRPDERGIDLGVIGFRSWVRAFVAAGHPILFLPGLIHLPTVPAHRKLNTIDLGTPDKLSVAALALRVDAETCPGGLAGSTFAVVEVGTAFTAVLVVARGQLVDAAAGTRGPLGLRSGGAWDGEVAYWRSPLSKNDLFRGGSADLGPEGPAALGESLRKHATGLQSVTPFDRVYISGAGLERPDVLDLVTKALEPLARVIRLENLPAARVKHATQGAALLADGLSGGRHSDLVASLRLLEASGTVLDWLRPGLSPPRPRQS
jgi:predicted butyrate kinase (DUF1464 family)